MRVFHCSGRFAVFVMMDFNRGGEAYLEAHGT